MAAIAQCWLSGCPRRRRETGTTARMMRAIRLEVGRVQDESIAGIGITHNCLEDDGRAAGIPADRNARTPVRFELVQRSGQHRGLRNSNPVIRAVAVAPERYPAADSSGLVLGPHLPVV